MAKSKWFILLLTELSSAVSLVVLIVSFSTDYWVTSEIKYIGGEAQIASSSVHYGLFNGKLNQVTASSRLVDLTLVCNFDINKCFYSCQQTSEKRREELDKILKGEILEMCPTSKSRQATNFNEQVKNVLAKATKINYNVDVSAAIEDEFLSAGLWLTTLVFLSMSSIIALISAFFSMLNILCNPVNLLTSTFGLYIWNGIGASLSAITMIIWSSFFAISIRKNIAITETLKSTGRYSSDGLANFGFSFWILIASVLCHLINIGLVYYRNYLLQHEIQVFMDNPFLIDDHAFDFGVYVLISSVNPLRIYRYDHEVFIRFCPEKYHPFDPLNTHKYVVDDDHLSVYDMPLFREMYAQYGYTFKLIFENFIEKNGFNVKSFWMKVDDAINSIILQNEKHILEKIVKEGLNTSVNFFELVRFDIVLDNNLNPYVMEVNMSPNLTPAGDRFEENVLIYEPLVYNTLKLISAGSYDDFKSRFNDETISTNFKNVATDFKKCTENECSKKCKEPTCIACLPCIEKNFIFHLFEAYREHVRKNEFKRIFPSNYHFNDSEIFNNLNDYNKIMFKWYEAKCENNQNWC